MSPNSSSPLFSRRVAAPAGFALLEVLAALAIMALVFASLHLTVGNAVRLKLRASSQVADQQHGRLVVAWIADRVRQAGFRADPASLLPRCRDAIVAQGGLYLPTAAELYITADVDNDGTPETRGFRITAIGGVNAVTETIMPCVTGAPAATAPLTDATTVEALSLVFAYYDAAGSPVTNLTNTAAIQSIRKVEVTFQVRASAGAQAPTDQTWTLSITLRNP